jgi:hypothetical protein
MLVVVLSACDPCAGVLGCSAGAYLSATGQIVDPATRTGVDGVRITAVRVGGIQLQQDSLTAVTSNGGFWRIQFEPAAAGTVDVDFIVTPPVASGYRLHSVQLATREHAGDANLNERWITSLYFNHLLEIYRRGTSDDRIQGAKVEFVRTGGVELVGPGVASGVFRDTTDFGGRMPLFPMSGPNAVYPAEDGPVIGDLSISTPELGTTVLRGLSLSSSHLYKEPAAIERYDIGRAATP